MTGYCMVLTTFESEAQADPVIGEILKEKLAACVQVPLCVEGTAVP